MSAACAPRDPRDGAQPNPSAQPVARFVTSRWVKVTRDYELDLVAQAYTLVTFGDAHFAYVVVKRLTPDAPASPWSVWAGYGCEADVAAEAGLLLVIESKAVADSYRSAMIHVRDAHDEMRRMNPARRNDPRPRVP